MSSNYNKISLFSISAFLIFITTGKLYAAETEPQAWLTRMSQAIHSLTYQGTFIYQQADQLHVMEIIHTQNEEGELERMTSLTGIQRDVFRSNNLVTCILPDTRSVIVERNDQMADGGNLPVSLPDLVQIQQFYSIDNGETARVAGRATQRINIKPRDNYRYTHSFWIDIENGMLLKSALYDEQGQLIEWFMFTYIDFPAEIPLARFKPEIKEKEFIWYQHDNAVDDDAKTELDQWHAANLPPGFKQLKHRRQYKYPDPRPIEHLVFSDGIATVSVFVEKLAPGEEPLIGPNRVGAVNTYGVVIAEYQITAVGEVPMSTLMAITNGMQKE